MNTKTIEIIRSQLVESLPEKCRSCDKMAAVVVQQAEQVVEDGADINFFIEANDKKSESNCR